MMGMYKPFSGGSIPTPSTTKAKYPYQPGNPNPYDYEIIRQRQIGSFLILKIRYPDCTNYKGHKILVYEDITFEELLENQNGIDPHFMEKLKNSKYPKGRYICPVARFEPTEHGWFLAISFCKCLGGDL
jgi:hypothetical protein